LPRCLWRYPFHCVCHSAPLSPPIAHPRHPRSTAARRALSLSPSHPRVCRLALPAAALGRSCAQRQRGRWHTRADGVVGGALGARVLQHRWCSVPDKPRCPALAASEMAGERVTARKRKAGGKTIIKKRTKKFARHQSDQFMRVPVRRPPPVCLSVCLCFSRGLGVREREARPASQARASQRRPYMRRRAGGGQSVWSHECGRSLMAPS
jgi:hypothetical protein